jgi:hypothetical protein
VVVGVPEITPVEASRESPAGREPSVILVIILSCESPYLAWRLAVNDCYLVKIVI